jgi:16S rRNA (cytosine1402-N4)-methyltransferase
MNVTPDDFMPGPVPEPTGHTTVLRDEVIALIGPRPGGIFVDATLGGGGHTEALLEAAPGATVLAIDQDPRAIEKAQKRLERFGTSVRFVFGRFSDLEKHLSEAGLTWVDGIVADLGISSNQLDDPSRGMSFRAEGPLDMRMGDLEGETALELIERLDNDELANIIYQYGDERRSRRIARCIQQALRAGELKTTLDLRRAVVRAVGPSRVGGIDPATRTFQALRIAVNHELEELEGLLESAPRLLSPAGVLAIISFHSLEDRLVKRAFLEAGTWQRLTPKPVVASRAETERNPRSRSAKLRAAKKATS